MWGGGSVCVPATTINITSQTDVEGGSVCFPATTTDITSQTYMQGTGCLCSAKPTNINLADWSVTKTTKDCWLDQSVYVDKSDQLEI